MVPLILQKQLGSKNHGDISAFLKGTVLELMFTCRILLENQSWSIFESCTQSHTSPVATEARYQKNIVVMVRTGKKAGLHFVPSLTSDMMMMTT